MQLRALLLAAAFTGALCALCGDRDCDIYDELSPVTNLGPPENDWGSQGIGLPPPGSPSTRSKREMLGGTPSKIYGAFDSVHEGHKQTEAPSSIPFAYRDVPWEPGTAFKSPGPGTQGHYLLLNADIPVDLQHSEPRPFGASDGSRYSSTGQRLPYDAEDTRADRPLSSNAEPYDALHGLYYGRHESPESQWASGSRAGTDGDRGSGRVRGGRADKEDRVVSYLEWPVDSDALFQSSNFTLELWVNPSPQQEPFVGLAGTLFSAGPIHSGWGLMLQNERMRTPRTEAFGGPEGGDPRGGGGAAGRQMPVSASGYQPVPAGMSCVHFVVCDSSVDIQGRVDPEVSFTDLVMLRPFCAAFVLLYQ